MSSIEETEEFRSLLQNCLDNLVQRIDRIQIGTNDQFPYGWRKAAKGRTVWRILEELITQNLEKYFVELGISQVIPSSSEVSIYDCELKFTGKEPSVFTNIKSAVVGARTNKDDISKAAGLEEFYRQDINRNLFVSTFVIDFQEDMHIKLERCVVIPIAWLPDIYVNPSNNANLQSAKYKDLDSAIRRTNEEFMEVLTKEMGIAREKREKKVRKAVEIFEEIIDTEDDGS